MTERQISPEELAERIAVMKRFRNLLEQQRRKFQEYLNVLELQHSEIETDNAEAMYAHAELETQIVSSIGSLQKVIIPIQDMYRSSVLNTKSLSDSHDEISMLEKELSDLHSKVLVQNKKNRDLLTSHMTQVKTTLANMSNNNPYRGKRSIYAEYSSVNSGSLIHIEA